jgi:glycosyltransferase involved in cell wall biosynthesis
MDPLISFVVPAYNEEALIGACLASIEAEISRTGCNAEIIVVNNNSSDRTREIASSIPGVIVVDELERGLVPARRAGNLAARGKLVANIDADAILPEGWLRKALAEFERTPRLAALSGPVVHYDLPKSAQFVAAVFFHLAFVVYVLMRFVFRAGSMLQGGNFIVSKAALDAAGGFNSDFRFYGEDTDLADRLSKVGPVKFSLGLRALSSGRRFAAEGLFRVGVRYATNYIWTVLFKEPYSPTWLDFRHEAGPSGEGTLTTANSVQVQPPAADFAPPV